MHYGTIFKGILTLLLASLLWAAMPALAARTQTVTLNTSGTPDNYTLEAAMRVDPADTGKSGVVYVAAVINGWLYFRDAGQNWLSWSGGKIPVYFQGVLGAHILPLLENVDTRQLEGAEFHVAYGLDEADMQANGGFELVHKVGADTVSMEGSVYVEGTTTPIAGAVISTSLDSQTTTTDAAGNFRIVSKSPASGGSASYTFSIKADGYQPFSKSSAWGDHPVGQRFYLTPAAANANPLVGVWRQTAASDPGKLTGQVIAFVDGGVMSSDDPLCTYLGGYAVSGDRLAMVPATSLVGGASCPTAGAALVGKFRLSGDILTIVAENSGLTFTYTKVAANLSKAGTWSQIYTTEVNAPAYSFFNLDAAGNVAEYSGKCTRKWSLTMAPVPGSSLVLKWDSVEGDNNSLCGTNHFPGKTETGFAVLAGNIMYMWTGNILRVFRKQFLVMR